MCSLGDEFEKEGEKHMPRDETVRLMETKCNKCREATPIILLRHKDAYCKACFLAGANHKFKSVLGKSKLIRPSNRVLVSYEVGHPCTALLHLLRSGLDLNTPKKLQFEPVLVFLEDQYHLTIKEREEMIKKVLMEADFNKFQMNLVSFADSVTTKNLNISQNSLAINENDGQKIDIIFTREISKSNKKEIVNILRRNTLICIANQLNCQYIFTPELSVDIASNLLTNISLGKGSQVPVDTGFCDNRDDNVTILRPLRTFDMKEVALYNVLCGLEPVSVRQIDTNQYSSIQVLMKQFVNTLQDNYPATVATVVRTGDKLALDQKKIIGKCKLCKGVILTKADELSSQQSTDFSKLVSNELPDHNISRQERYAKVKDKFDNRSQLENKYCFSCSKITQYLLEDT